MDYIKLIGMVLVVIGTIAMYFSDFIQSKTDHLFKKQVSEFVMGQHKRDVPEIEVLSIKGTLPNISLVVKNTGNKKAFDVQLVYSDKSIPSAFSANTISIAREIPNSVEYELSMNIFYGISMLSKLPNDEEKYKNDLIAYMDKYKKGEKVLIPKFNIKYSDGKTEIVSPTYYFIINEGKVYGLDKED